MEGTMVSGNWVGSRGEREELGEGVKEGVERGLSQREAKFVVAV
jgi:hypothetical protein